jgi:hypothetical protein
MIIIPIDGWKRACDAGDWLSMHLQDSDWTITNANVLGSDKYHFKFKTPEHAVEFSLRWL